MNAATSFYATFQQLSLSVGICLAAVLLRMAGSISNMHDAQHLVPYSIAFLSVAGVSSMAIASIARLSRAVGQQ